MLTIITFWILATSSSLSLVILIRAALIRQKSTRHTVLPTAVESLPTVSVCIPARNESDAMTQCLERVIASTYPKLEIIVFDDESGDNTSFLIKSFAHAGVRFIEGISLPEGWLGKNYAQQHLFLESSGEYILYLDVDTHIMPDTIEVLVSQLLAENATMVSVLPSRNDGWRASVLFATLRYFWAIILHRKARPAVASSLWLISRAYLEQHTDGFEALKNTIEPEVTVAARLLESKQYRFYLNDTQLGVSYEKKWRSQCETAIRLLFPLVGGTTRGFITGFIALSVLLYPFCVVILAFPLGIGAAETLLAVLAIALLISAYGLYLLATWKRGKIVGLFLLPITLIQELALLIISAYKYRTQAITWKGRPVHIITKAPRTI